MARMSSFMISYMGYNLVIIVYSDTDLMKILLFVRMINYKRKLSGRGYTRLIWIIIPGAINLFYYVFYLAIRFFFQIPILFHIAAEKESHCLINPCRQPA